MKNVERRIKRFYRGTEDVKKKIQGYNRWYNQWYKKEGVRRCGEGEAPMPHIYMRGRCGGHRAASRIFVGQAQIIGNHGDKLAVSRLSAVILNGEAEIRVEYINVTSVPCDLYRVAYRTLNA